MSCCYMNLIIKIESIPLKNNATAVTTRASIEKKTVPERIVSEAA